MTRSPYAQKWRRMLRQSRRRTYRETGGHNDAGITLTPAPQGADLTQGVQTMHKLLALLKSRKFWGAIAGVLIVVLTAVIPDFPLDADQVSNVIYVIVAFILGTGLEDGLRGRLSG
jgi:hypothetical protein